MLAIQAGEDGVPVVLERVRGDGGKYTFVPMTAERWRESVVNLVDPEVPNLIVQVVAASAEQMLCEAPDELVSFSQWCKEVDSIATHQGQIGSLVDQTGESYWKEHYDKGASPQAAYEEMSDCC